jgi:hypothetical protein
MLPASAHPDTDHDGDTITVDALDGAPTFH